jgi:methionyl aminopeptidase
MSRSVISIKSPSDIEGMRKSGKALRSVLEELTAKVVPGVTTRELDQMAADMIKARGGKSPFLNYRGFKGNICISLNEEVVHGLGGFRRVQYGDIVKLDMGIVIDGWVADMATTVRVGEVKPEVAKLWQATQESLLVGIEQARPGNHVHDISAAVEQYVEKRGFSVVREFVGHGIGRELHEEPQVPNYGRAGTGPKLKPGMTICIEPMVNLGVPEVKILGDGWTVVTADGKPSCHFEHTVLITEDEPEILTCLETNGSK